MRTLDRFELRKMRIWARHPVASSIIVDSDGEEAPVRRARGRQTDAEGDKKSELGERAEERRRKVDAQP